MLVTPNGTVMLTHEGSNGIWFYHSKGTYHSAWQPTINPVDLVYAMRWFIRAFSVVRPLLPSHRLTEPATYKNPSKVRPYSVSLPTDCPRPTRSGKCAL